MQLNRDGERKLFKQFGLFSLLLFFFSYSSLGAKSFEDFKRLQESSFEKYRDANDAAFHNYLKEQWQEYSAQKPKSFYKKEKPKSITPTISQKIKSVGPYVNIEVKPLEKKEYPKIARKEPLQKDLNFIFFGQPVSFDIDAKIREAKFYPHNQTGISNYFDRVASSDYEDTIREIKDTQKRYNLNDWGLYLLVNAIAKHIYDYPDEIELFSWFIFNKLGYRVKIGLNAKHVELMYYSDRTIYATPSYAFKGEKFYVLSHYAKGSLGKIYTYKQDYPNAHRAIDLRLDTLPNFQKDIHHKKLSFKEFGTKYTASFRYDKNLIDFMSTYPQVEYETFFDAPMSAMTYHDIAQDLKRYTNAKSSSVAINFVLNFVQKAFGYERDQEQFSREKVMFAEETLYYDKSDCEDRAILFAYLVRELFGISVVGVKYKDHMATALYIPMKGDSVRVGRRNFVIADPTYINANIGQSMPKYRFKTPESFIVLRRSE